MRRFLIVLALVFALAGSIGAGVARISTGVHPTTSQTQAIADGSSTPSALCGGSSSTYC